MNDLSILVILMSVTTVGYTVTHYKKWFERLSVRIDDFVLNWFDRRGLKRYYQTWGHCGLCGKPMDGIFDIDWAWGICQDHLQEKVEK